MATLLANSPAMLEAHFGVPAAGGVLVTVNQRLSSAEIGYILEHSGARYLLLDAEFEPLVAPLELPGVTIIRCEDSGAPGDPYEEFLAAAPRALPESRLAHEEETISINYTSGTTGRPKGVQYTYRGAYLNALNEVIVAGLSPESVYLWTLPMFHCNGWCFPWAVTAVAARHVTMRAVDPEQVWDLIDNEGVTNFNGSPTVQLMVINHPRAHRLERSVTALVAAAPPSPTLLARMGELNFRAVHVYGLTETYGPITLCSEQEDWSELPLEQRAKRLARQGQAYISADLVRVVDTEMNDVPQDGETMGEVIMRGNNVMSGYFEDEAATESAFAGGWFHSGDLGVWHPDGNIELRDRGKDVIISGGENISSIEVEQAVVAHPAVLECAVIGIPHEHWGERPKAFVTLKEGPRRPSRSSSPSPATASRTTSARTRSSSVRCRRRRPGRSGSSSCANASGPGRRSGSERPERRPKSAHPTATPAPASAVAPGTRASSSDRDSRMPPASTSRSGTEPRSAFRPKTISPA